MTETNDKIRALLLTALMVFSVFAGTFAFAGTAAAASASSVSISTAQPVQPGTSTTVSFTSANTNTYQAAVDANGDDVIQADEVVGSTTGSGGAGDTITFTPSTAAELGSSADGDYTVVVIEAADASSADGTAVGDAGSATLTVDGVSPSISDVQIVDDDESGVVAAGETVTVTATVTDTNSISSVSADASGFNGGSISLVNDGSGADADGSDNVYTGTFTATSPVTDAEQLVSVSATDAASNSASSDSNSLLFDSEAHSKDVDATFETTTALGGSLLWNGQTFAVGGLDPTTDVELREVTENGNRLVEQLSTDDNGVIMLDTANLDAGDYYLVGASAGMTESDSFEIASQTLSAEFASDSVQADDTTDVEFNSNRGTYSVNVTAEGLTASELATVFDSYGSSNIVVDDENDRITLNGVNDGNVEVDFSSVDTGEYNFTYTVVDTGVEANDSINVQKAASGKASLPGTVEVAQGDVAEITVDLTEASSGTLVIGDEESAGYQANVSFSDEDDDGQVTIQFNTYAAGSSANVVSADGEDTASLTNTGQQNDFIEAGTLLDDGEYELAVSTAGTAADTKSEPSDLGTIFIAERSTDSMQLWTAPGSADLNADGEDSVSADDVSSLVQSGAVTQDSSIAQGDYVIHQVNASGLGGLIAENGDLQTAIGNGLSVKINQTNPSRNRAPKMLDLSKAITDGEVTLVESDGVYYIAIRLDDTKMFQRDGSGDYVAASAGDEFQSKFVVESDKLLGSDKDSAHQSVNASFETLEGQVSLNSDPVNVSAADGAAISGTSNYAPGTELTVRVRSTGETQPRFFNTKTVNVDSNGTYTAAFNFSDQSEGDTFSVSVRKGSTQVASADGEVVAAQQTTTGTAGTTTAGTTEQPTTEQPTTEQPTTESTPTETESEETTSTSTPGFGAVLAVIALIGAALLAVRRD